MRPDEDFSLYDLSFFDEADFVTVFTAYFDASANGGMFTVGGLLFRKKEISAFEGRWRYMIRKYSIPYFHMAECNSRQGVFAHLSEEECIDCATMAIDAVANHAAKGATWTVSIKEFDEIVGKAGILPSPLLACAYPAMMDLANWANNNDHSPPPRIFYVFESGDTDQGDVENLLRAVSETGSRQERFRYEDHAFLPKEGSLPTQGADILAWHGSKHARRRTEGNTHLRGDFDALVKRLEITDGLASREFLQDLTKIAEEAAGERFDELGLRGVEGYGPQLAQLAIMMNKSNRRASLAKARSLGARDD